MSNLIATATLCLLAGVPPAPSTVADQPAPRDMTGRWTWKWTDRDGGVHHHEMVVEGQPGKYAARERLDDLEPAVVEMLKLEGDRVSFSVPRGDTRATYTGTFADPNTINGEVRVQQANNQVEEYGWTATRVVEEQESPDGAAPGAVEDPERPPS